MMRRLTSLPYLLFAGGLGVLTLGFAVIVLSELVPWSDDEANATPVVHVTYWFDHQPDLGLVVAGRRQDCLASWPSAGLDPSVRVWIASLPFEDGGWVWEGDVAAWQASGLPDPCVAP